MLALSLLVVLPLSNSFFGNRPEWSNYLMHTIRRTSVSLWHDFDRGLSEAKDIKPAKWVTELLYTVESTHSFSSKPVMLSTMKTIQRNASVHKLLWRSGSRLYRAPNPQRGVESCLARLTQLLWTKLVWNRNDLRPRVATGRPAPAGGMKVGGILSRRWKSSRVSQQWKAFSASPLLTRSMERKKGSAEIRAPEKLLVLFMRVWAVLFPHRHRASERLWRLWQKIFCQSSGSFSWKLLNSSSSAQKWCFMHK